MFYIQITIDKKVLLCIDRSSITIHQQTAVHLLFRTILRHLLHSYVR